MKRIITTTAAALTTLTLAAPAFAQTNVNPCAPGGIGNPFNNLCTINSTNFGSVISNAVLFLFIVAALIALFFLIWGGIKWILSGGDKGKVEIARGTIVAAVIGLLVTFLSFFILQLVLGLFGISLMNLTLPKLIG
jgi:hypothetical protein